MASSTSLSYSVISTCSVVLHAAFHSSWNVASWCALRPREVVAGGMAYSPVRGVQRLRGLQNWYCSVQPSTERSREAVQTR